jgi:hypothetical protein
MSAFFTPLNRDIGLSSFKVWLKVNWNIHATQVFPTFSCMDCLHKFRKEIGKFDDIRGI